jgi:tRNA(His) guanylyltransferase
VSQFDTLGDRMKDQYERRARTMLPRRTWTVVRLDGRAFHSYTRGLERPFDAQLMADMAATTAELAKEVSGCRLAYTQSDEISLVVTDFADPNTQAWFDGNQQKIVSITAALATAVFNDRRPGKRALFDSRAFTIPDPVEVENYLIWRQQDATRNSVQMAAQAKFSPRQLHGKNGNELQEMLWREYGVNWNDYPPAFKRGALIVPVTRVEPVAYLDRRTGLTCTTPEVERRVWTIVAAPMFTKVRDWLAPALHGDPVIEIPTGDPS